MNVMVAEGQGPGLAGDEVFVPARHLPDPLDPHPGSNLGAIDGWYDHHVRQPRSRRRRRGEAREEKKRTLALIDERAREMVVIDDGGGDEASTGARTTMHACSMRSKSAPLSPPTRPGYPLLSVRTERSTLSREGLLRRGRASRTEHQCADLRSWGCGFSC